MTSDRGGYVIKIDELPSGENASTFDASAERPNLEPRPAFNGREQLTLAQPEIEVEEGGINACARHGNVRCLHRRTSTRVAMCCLRMHGTPPEGTLSTPSPWRESSPKGSRSK